MPDVVEPTTGNSGWERLTDRLAVGVLTRLLSRDVVDEVVVQAGRRAQRVRLLPARVVVSFVLAMCLFFEDGYEEVMRKLVGGLHFLRSWSREWMVPTTGAMSQARARWGEVPLRLLFERVAVPMARPGTRGAWLGSWRLMAADGVQLEVPDTPANTAAFGKALHRSEPGPFPQARVVGLAEGGTHAVVAARIGALHEGERDLADGLLGDGEAGMLVRADRGLASLVLWTAAAATGAYLLWRVSASVDLPVVEVLPDGSYRSVLADVIARQRHRRRLRAGRPDPVVQGLPVRVIEYQIADRGGSGEMFCLITTILEPDRAPAAELAWAYSQRWEFEVALAEIETGQRGPHRMLRSKSPELVRQEIWALLTTHDAIRDLRRQAADDVDLDPDRMSFLRSLRVVRRQVIDPAVFPPDRLALFLAIAIAEIAERPTPPRRHRTCPRVVKRHRTSPHRVKRHSDKATVHHGPPTIHILALAPPN